MAEHSDNVDNTEPMATSDLIPYWAHTAGHESTNDAHFFT